MYCGKTNQDIQNQ